MLLVEELRPFAGEKGVDIGGECLRPDRTKGITPLYSLKGVAVLANSMAVEYGSETCPTHTEAAKGW